MSRDTQALPGGHGKSQTMPTISCSLLSSTESTVSTQTRTRCGCLNEPQCFLGNITFLCLPNLEHSTGAKLWWTTYLTVLQVCTDATVSQVLPTPCAPSVPVSARGRHSSRMLKCYSIKKEGGSVYWQKTRRLGNEAN